MLRSPGRGNPPVQSGALQQAVLSFDRAIALSPAWPTPISCGAGVRRKYDPERALRDFTKVIELHPADPRDGSRAAPLISSLTISGPRSRTPRKPSRRATKQGAAYTLRGVAAYARAATETGHRQISTGRGPGANRRELFRARRDLSDAGRARARSRTSTGHRNDPGPAAHFSPAPNRAARWATRPAHTRTMPGAHSDGH